MSAYAPHLLDYEQQDCQEFLRFLLDSLSEDLSSILSVQHTTNSSSQRVTILAEESSTISSPDKMTSQPTSSPNGAVARLRQLVQSADTDDTSSSSSGK